MSCEDRGDTPSVCLQGTPFRQGGPNQYHTETDGGAVTITEYNVFPGIWLAFHEIQALAFSPPPGYPAGLLEISHCQRGRLEYQAGDRCFFLGIGDLSLHRSSCQSLFRCPTGRYTGLSVVIDPALAPWCTTCLLGDVEVDLTALCQRFSGGDVPFVLRATPRLEHVFSELYAAPEALRKGYLKVKVLELLLFLSSLDPSQAPGEGNSCTRDQVELVEKVFAFLGTHRDQRYTAEQLAAAFHVSPEHLRRSVKRVYGKPLYQCVRNYKMDLAAVVLQRSNRTVTDIAGEFGYDNSSKFAAAFRAALGCSPADYRRKAPSAGSPAPWFGAKNE